MAIALFEGKRGYPPNIDPIMAVLVEYHVVAMQDGQVKIDSATIKENYAEKHLKYRPQSSNFLTNGFSK